MPPATNATELRPDGDTSTVVPADCVLVAIGSVPATDWLAASGLALGDGHHRPLSGNQACTMPPDDGSLTCSGPRGLLFAKGAVETPADLKGTVSPVDNAVVSEPPAGSDPPRRPSAGTILTLVNGVLASVGGVFVGTHSVLITIIAAVAAITLAAMVLTTGR